LALHGIATELINLIFEVF